MDDEDPMSSLNCQAGQEQVVVSLVTAPCRKNTHAVHAGCPIYNMAKFKDELRVGDEALLAFIGICLRREIPGGVVGLTPNPMGASGFEQRLGYLVADHRLLGFRIAYQPVTLGLDRGTGWAG